MGFCQNQALWLKLRGSKVHMIVVVLDGKKSRWKKIRGYAFPKDRGTVSTSFIKTKFGEEFEFVLVVYIS